MRDLLLSDLHFHPRRQGGTTIHSRIALEHWLLQSFENLLGETHHDRIIIVGDLLDRRSVSEKTIKELVRILRGRQVVLVRGNHDSGSDKYGEISALELIDSVLGTDCKLVFHEPEQIDHYYIIPHMFNQEQFDQALLSVPNDTTVLLHCNLDNNMAVGDHSLNITGSQVKEILAKGCDIIMGHEHTARDLYGSKVRVLGCAFPTSISDCLGGSKRALLGGESIETWSPCWYREINYNEAFLDEESQFISITGTCQQSEFPDVVKRVANLRSRSNAFVIKNAVKVIGKEKTEVIQEVTNFNIINVFLSELPEEYKERAKLCLI